MGFCSKVLVDKDKTQTYKKPTMNILALLQTNLSGISKTTLRQMNGIIIAMLSMTGRITMLGLSRWAGEGGSYRTIQRFYSTAIPWAQVLCASSAKACFTNRRPRKPKQSGRSANRAGPKAARTKTRRPWSSLLSCSAFRRCSKRCLCG